MNKKVQNELEQNVIWTKQVKIFFLLITISLIFDSFGKLCFIFQNQNEHFQTRKTLLFPERNDDRGELLRGDWYKHRPRVELPLCFFAFCILPSERAAASRQLPTQLARLSVRRSTSPSSSGSARPAPTCPCLLYTSPSPRDGLLSRMPSSA